MTKIRLYNPENGADIITRYVHRDDEVKKMDEKTKEFKVTNAKKVDFPKGSHVTTDRKTADYILRTWGFVEEVPLKDVDVPKDVETPEIEAGEASEDIMEDNIADDVEKEEKGEKTEEKVEGKDGAETPQAEFERLKSIMAWLNPELKDRYLELRDKLNPKK
jgi:hypothetical protein